MLLFTAYKDEIHSVLLLLALPFFLTSFNHTPGLLPPPLMLLSRVQFFFETRDNYGRDSLLFHAAFVANRRIDMEKHLSRNFFLSIANMYGNNLVISL